MSVARQQSALDDETQRLRQFDFRNPSKMAREHVRRLELTHETFVRSMGNELSNLLRTMVRLELMSIDQITYDEYIRSTPNPSVITQISLAPLPGVALFEMGTQTALVLVDRLLGGIGKPSGVRRPTELEGSLIAEILGYAVGPIRETFAPLIEVEPVIESVEYNPNFVQATNPSEMVMVMSYSLSIIEGLRSEGLLTICYPFSTLQPATQNAVEDEVLALAASTVSHLPLRDLLPDVEIPVSVRLTDTPFPGSQLHNLQVGDVLVLDHKVEEEVIAVAASAALLGGRIGRKGKNMAFEVANWRTQ
ncbi:flagellar motor switch protein FliM [bacterium BMS3Bbin02]|nr:flagellar motor switch protein FliM [bacterium BMS3Bbin02]